MIGAQNDLFGISGVPRYTSGYFYTVFSFGCLPRTPLGFVPFWLLLLAVYLQMAEIGQGKLREEGVRGPTQSLKPGGPGPGLCGPG